MTNDSKSSKYRLIRALLKQPVDQTPVWIMRQAGRYLPEYLKIRKVAKDFMTLCKTPELATKVTLQPVTRFPLDAAIIFSDILVIPDAMGCSVQVKEKVGPVFDSGITNFSDVKKLNIPDPTIDLKYVLDVIKETRSALNERIPVIGFAGSPWTLASYMIEKKARSDFSKIKSVLYNDTKLLDLLLEKLSLSVTDYLNAQIEAGVDAIMIFDTWGSMLTTPDYLRFSLSNINKIISDLNTNREGKKIPIIVYTKGCNHWLEYISQSGCDAVSVDWTINLSKVHAMTKGKLAIQGNMDPNFLFSNPNRIHEEVNRIITDFDKKPGHIFNLGHGIHKDTPIENVEKMIDSVQSYSLNG